MSACGNLCDIVFFVKAIKMRCFCNRMMMMAGTDIYYLNWCHFKRNQTKVNDSLFIDVECFVPQNPCEVFACLKPL